MLAKINSLGFEGIDGYSVIVELDISNGVPSFDVVGLPGLTVRESRERVRAAIKNSNYVFPIQRVTVNLAPADKRKEGAIYDLPIALGVLCATGIIKSDLTKSAFIGELSLDGSVRGIHGAIAMLAAAVEEKYERIYLPIDNANEVACIKGIEIIAIKSLGELIQILNNDIPTIAVEKIDYRNLQTNNTAIVDFKYVKGQYMAKRALEIATSGAHNVLMIGPPGSGKTMMARALPGILPPLTFNESLEVTKIHSISGAIPSGGGLLVDRPFRSPHHTSSTVSLTGGGSKIRPGEISLAHNGVLFLDEFPEFQRPVLEALRQPLEDGVITVSRASGNAVFPSDVMLIASMNPCPCGHYGSQVNECLCTQHQISRYLGKLSGPLLDRIDLQVEVEALPYSELNSSKLSESSHDIRARVRQARQIQIDRYKDDGILYNSQLGSKQKLKYCKLDKESEQTLRDYFKKLSLSARAHDRILKISRTIADLDSCKNIQSKHIMEALQYRTLDRKYWKHG